MQYMPERDLVVCGCGKCGSTSIYQFIYEHEFGQKWPYTDAPYPQDLLSERWAGKWTMKHDQKLQKKIMEHSTSFALIRDPKERLVSAWKSKVTCDDSSYGVDVDDRAHWMKKEGRWRGFVPALQRLRGADDNTTCLSLEEFSQALYDIQLQGNSKYLDRHFLPQSLGCFKRFPPNTWTAVGPITERGSLEVLAAKLRSNTTHVPEVHNSRKKVIISKEAADLLDMVTIDEYKLLGRYLAADSRVQAGNAV